MSAQKHAFLLSIMFRLPIRSFSTVGRQSFKIGLIPADGIGKEVIPVISHCLSYIHENKYKTSSGSKSSNLCFGFWYSQARIHWFGSRLGVLYEDWYCSSSGNCRVCLPIWCSLLSSWLYFHFLVFCVRNVTVRSLDLSGMFLWPVIITYVSYRF